MKKTFKLFSFILACIFCLAAMTSSVFAVDNHSVSTCSMDACPDHPNAGWNVSWGQTPNGTLIHYYTCKTCGFAFDSDECLFTGYGDCTTYSYCILCDQPNPVQYDDHEFVGSWNWSQYISYHWRTCIHTNCFEEEHGTHDRDGKKFGEIDPSTGNIYEGQEQDTCEVCGYIWPLT